MPGQVTFKVRDAGFARTLRRYREFSKRDPEVIVNTKAFYVARRAVLETPKTPPERIRALLAETGGYGLWRIINWRRGQAGKPGLWGPAMKKAVRVVLAARLRSRAFLRAGWLPAIKRLEPLAEKRGAPRADRTVKARGADKGWATPARPGWVAKAIIANTAQSRWDKGGALKRGVAALGRAIAFEKQSMLAYIERKMKQTAVKAGVKTR